MTKYAVDHDNMSYLSFCHVFVMLSQARVSVQGA